MKLKFKAKVGYVAVAALVLYFFFNIFRLDLTDDKRFSVSDQTKELMAGIPEPLDVTVYLEGDLNPSFLRLKRATAELLEELNVYSDRAIQVHFVNPSDASSASEREKRYTELASRGLVPTAVYERDKEGQSVQKVIFPWLEVRYKGKRVAVSLLRNIPGNSGEQNLNISIEGLEFQLTDGIRRVVNSKVRKIAFLEGHGEFNDRQTYDVSKALSDYFQIDRGVLANDAAVLDPYEAVIIAGPQLAFSEKDKFVLDQYVMRGGRILWLIDGVRMSRQSLSVAGMSPAIKLDLNLDDQLFNYGVRINPVLLEDVQSVTVPVNIAPMGEKPHFEPSPWFFAPILLTSPEHVVTRNIAEVKSEFPSSVDVVGDDRRVKKHFLLASSDNTHIEGVPATIDLRAMPKSTDRSFFNMAYVPVAVALDGCFSSNFSHRMVPPGLMNVKPMRDLSVQTRQIVVADAEIIRNEIAADSSVVPLGYDRYMNQQFGNKDFVLNAVLYLTDNGGWMNLKNRSVKMRLLNKHIVVTDRLFWQIVNVILPVVVLLMAGVLYWWLRKRKYTH